MVKILMGVLIGMVLGIAMLFSVQYAMNLNTRVFNIEKFLIQAQQQAQRPAPAPVTE